jgi:hypothetical protein
MALSLGGHICKLPQRREIIASPTKHMRRWDYTKNVQQEHSSFLQAILIHLMMAE